MKLNAKEISELNAERAGHQARIQEIDVLLAKHTSIIAHGDALKLAELYKKDAQVESILDAYAKGN
jgi:hypothetical protein